MNKYFTPNPATLEELKKMYRELAMKHHPDIGGDTETMKIINNEYDSLFPVFQARHNIKAETENTETAAGTRSEFYTQNGWNGENYNGNLSLKEIACIIREFIKIHYNECKFSVTTEYYSGGCSLYIALMESPYRAYKTFDELTDEGLNRGEMSQVIKQYTQAKNINSWHTDEIKNIIRPMYDKDFGAEDEIYLPQFLTDEIKEPVQAVEKYANSFNFDDCDGQIDYFHVNFWFHGVKIGQYDKPYKIVERTRKNIPDVEYENVEVTKTRTYKTLEVKDIKTPREFKPGQLFQLKSSFNYGRSKGYVYQIDRINGDYIEAYKMDRKYKNMCKGSDTKNRFYLSTENLKKWVEKGAIKFVELKEVIKTEEYKSSVRRPKKQTEAATFTEEPESRNANAKTESEASNEYTITRDTDTRDNSDLWVLKILRTLAADEYKQIADKIKSIKGYYSRFKRGFIFRYDPAEAIKEVI